MPTMDPIKPSQKYITVKQLCECWGVSRKFIWDLSTRKGEDKLPSYKVGGRRLFLWDDCQWYMEKRRSAA